MLLLVLGVGIGLMILAHLGVMLGVHIVLVLGMIVVLVAVATVVNLATVQRPGLDLVRRGGAQRSRVDPREPAREPDRAGSCSPVCGNKIATFLEDRARPEPIIVIETARKHGLFAA